MAGQLVAHQHAARRDQLQDGDDELAIAAMP
jgi:hypothetical protein